MTQLGPREYQRFVDSLQMSILGQFLPKVREIELGQWEVPFEALLVEMMKHPKAKIDFDWELVSALATEAGIEDEGVLDVDTWQKFCAWAGRN